MRNFLISLKKKQDGFISVVALGLFALLAFFGIIVQLTVEDTFEQIGSTNNYYAARDIAESMTEYLQYTASQREAGYNTDDGTGRTQLLCDLNEGINTAEINTPECQAIASMLSTSDPVYVSLQVKGRAWPNERMVSQNCGLNPINQFNNDCYAVPYPGTGTVSDMCNLYTPAIGTGSNLVNSTLAGSTNIDQADYVCNWNKLTFGSNLTDRAVIPLFHDDGGTTVGTVSPFYGTTATANYLLLRLRTPCLPCVYNSGQVQAGINRLCTAGQDPNSCTAANRYYLDELDGNDIVAQWQISGTCLNTQGVEEECGYVPNITGVGVSALTESRINNESRHILMENNDTSINNTTNGVVVLNNVLTDVNNPILTLFLHQQLISENGNNIPYLEYQILADEPISDSRTKIELAVNYNGNLFRKVLYSSQQSDLIDFAIQN